MITVPLFERILWFHSRVSQNVSPSLAHLTERFELSRRTAKRGLEHLRDRFATPQAHPSPSSPSRFCLFSIALPTPESSPVRTLCHAILLFLAIFIPLNSPEQFSPKTTRVPSRLGTSRFLMLSATRK